jgi:hypothetical protein
MTDTVTVASKLPFPLQLHIDQMVEVREAMFNGGERTVMRAMRLPETYTLKGNAISHAPQADNPRLYGGFALTSGIPRAFWEKWLEQHVDMDIVRNHQVFAGDKPGHTEGAAKEKAEVRSGLEPMRQNLDGTDPDPRIPKTMSGAITKAAGL